MLRDEVHKKKLDKILSGEICMITCYSQAETCELSELVNSISIEDLPLYLNSRAYLEFERGFIPEHTLFIRCVIWRLQHSGNPVNL